MNNQHQSKLFDKSSIIDDINKRATIFNQMKITICSKTEFSWQNNRDAIAVYNNVLKQHLIYISPDQLEDIARAAASKFHYSDHNTYDYIKYRNTTKYIYFSMYNIYIIGKEPEAPWDYLQLSKAEFIMLYYADVRQQYEDNIKYTRTCIIKRSISF